MDDLLFHAHRINVIGNNTIYNPWLLNREIPQKTTLAAIRNPNDLKGLIQTLINLRAVDVVAPKLRMRKLHYKFSTLHLFFTRIDIHIFLIQWCVSGVFIPGCFWNTQWI